MTKKSTTTTGPEGSSELGLLMEAIDGLTELLNPEMTLRDFQDAMRDRAGSDTGASAIQGFIAAAAYRVDRICATRVRPILDPPALPKAPRRASIAVALSAEDFAEDIIAVSEEGRVEAREVVLRIKRRRKCGRLVVNGRVAGVDEVRQMGARLAREGKIAQAVR